MPVHTRSVYARRIGDHRYTELKQRLVNEWSATPGPTPVPDIVEETDAQDRVVHVTVTWDEWADFDAQTRSEMIVDAFQMAKGAAAAADLALAMGLTTAEAARMTRG